MHLEILLIELFVSLIFNEACDIMIKNEPLDKQSSNPKNNDGCLHDWNAEKENCSNVCKHSNFDPLIETLRQEWVLSIKDWTLLEIYNRIKEFDDCPGVKITSHANGQPQKL